MATSSEHDYSLLSDLEGKLMLFDFFITGSVAITLALIICAILASELKSHHDNNPYYVYAIKTTFISVLCTVFLYIVKMFFMNNFFVSWDYTSSSTFITSFDSIYGCFKLVSKLTFYFGFTYIIQSIFYSHNNGETLSLSLKVWMVFVTIVTTAAVVLKLVADMTQNEDKEIGVIQTYNIFVLMYLSVGGEYIGQIAVAMAGILDMVYFIILGYLYTAKLRKINIAPERGAKGIILVFISCVVMWIYVIFIVENVAYKYVLSGLDAITDNVCLFLMFASGHVIYANSCGCLCGSCCAKMIYGSRYKYVDDDNADASDALL